MTTFDLDLALVAVTNPEPTSLTAQVLWREGNDGDPKWVVFNPLNISAAASKIQFDPGSSDLSSGTIDQALIEVLGRLNSVNSTLTNTIGTNDANQTAAVQAVSDNLTQTQSDLGSLTTTVNAHTADIADHASALTQEIADRTNADTSLNTSITNLSTSLSGDISDINTNIGGINDTITTLSASVNDNATNLAAEVSNRVAQYNGLNTTITDHGTSITQISDGLAQEITDREGAITTLSNQLSSTNDNLTAEIANRAAGDALTKSQLLDQIVNNPLNALGLIALAGCTMPATTIPTVVGPERDTQLFIGQTQTELDSSSYTPSDPVPANTDLLGTHPIYVFLGSEEPIFYATQGTTFLIHMNQGQTLSLMAMQTDTTIRYTVASVPDYDTANNGTPLLLNYNEIYDLPITGTSVWVVIQSDSTISLTTGGRAVYPAATQYVVPASSLAQATIDGSAATRSSPNSEDTDWLFVISDKQETGFGVYNGVELQGIPTSARGDHYALPQLTRGLIALTTSDVTMTISNLDGTLVHSHVINPAISGGLASYEYGDMTGATNPLAFSDPVSIRFSKPTFLLYHDGTKIYSAKGYQQDLRNANSRGYAKVVQLAASNAAASSSEAASYASAASASKNAAESAAANSANSATASQTSADLSGTYADNASASADAAHTFSNTAATQASNAAQSATDAATSETNAAGSAAAASTSATNAAGSASDAGNSATAAQTYASNAQTYATNANDTLSQVTTAFNNTVAAKNAAETAATNAGQSELNAAQSATDAGTAASNASTYASNAAQSATDAGTSATAAQNSASSAQTYATNAGDAASAATTQAGLAATSATSASNSATAASTSETNASTYAGNALTSALKAQDAGVIANHLDASPAMTFTFNGTDGGWTSVGTGTSSIQVIPNGTGIYLNLSAATGTVGMVSPVLQPADYLAGSRYDHVLIRIRRKDSGTNSITPTLQYATNDHAFSPSYQAVLPAVSVSDTEWVYLVFDMSNLTAGGTDWVDSTSIKQLAFYPGSANDYIVGYVMAVGPDTAAPAAQALIATQQASSASTSASQASASAGNALVSAQDATTSAATATSQANLSATSASLADLNRVAAEYSGSGIQNPGFELGRFLTKDVSLTTAPQGWEIGYGTPTLGYHEVSVASLPTLKFNSTTALTTNFGGNLPGIWSISKDFLARGSGTLTVKLQFLSGGTINYPPTLGRNTSNQSFVGEDDVAIKITCYDSQNNVLTQSARAQWSDTVSQYALDQGKTSLGTTIPNNTLLDFAWSFQLAAGTERVHLEVYGLDGNNALRDFAADGLIATTGHALVTVDNFEFLANAELIDITGSGYEARQAANAANTSAQAASTSATEAGDQAAAASISATNASTSAGQAGTYASNAAQSATNASGSASTASTQAGIATSAVSTAQGVLNSIISHEGNPYFSEGITGWSNSPTANVVPTVSYSFVQQSGAKGGSVLHVAASNNLNIYSVDAIPVDINKRYAVHARYRVSSGTSTTAKFWIGFVGLDQTGIAVDHGSFGPHRYAITNGAKSISASAGWQEARVVIKGIGNDSWTKFPPNTSQIKLVALLNTDATTVSVELDYLYIDDAENVEQAGDYASNASVSASAAASSAASISGAVTTATTQAGIATNAANTATGAATNASVSETNAAQSATNAAQSASDASGSASTAAEAASSASSSAVVAAAVGGSGIALIKNTIFQDWPAGNSYPTGYQAWMGTPPGRNVSDSLIGQISAQYSTDGTSSFGMSTTIASPQPIVDYVVLDVFMYSSLGASTTGAGIILGWVNNSGTHFNTYIPTSAMTYAGNNLFNYSAVITKPAGFTGTLTSYQLFIVGDDTSLGARQAKTVIFERVALRTASAEEIRTFNVDDEISASVAVETSARVSSIGSIEAKYSVKVDANGYVSGFGLISDANDGTPTSTFTVLADNFKVAKPGVVAPQTVFSIGTVKGQNALVLGDTYIGDNSISTRSIVLQDNTNLVPDNQLLTAADTWTIPGGWDFLILAASGFSIPRYFNHTYVSGETGYFGFVGSPQFPVKAGVSYFATWQQFGTAGTSNLLTRIHYFDANGVTMDPTYTTLANQTGDGTVQDMGAQFTPPTGARTAQFRFYTNRTSAVGGIQFSSPAVREQNAASLIVEGGINAFHVATGSLDADVIGTGRLTSAFLEITDLMTIDASNAGFQMGKDSAFDLASDGMFMGRTLESDGSVGFGFAVGRNNGGVLEYIQGTKSTGLVLQNAKFKRLFSTGGSPVYVTTSQTVTLPVGSQTLDLSLIGGGAGGGSTGPGNAGGNTVVQLYDGATLKATYTAPGGSGANGTAKGGDSPWGTGGAGGTFVAGHWGGNGGGDSGPVWIPDSYTNGGNATGYGAGGGGAYGSTMGGKASALVSLNDIDISTYAAPKIVITIGAKGTGTSSQGNGSPGRVMYAVSSAATITADVIPVRPTTTGTMNNTGPFPALGAGLWILTQPGDDNLVMGNITIDDKGTTIRGWGPHAITFVSNITPTVSNVGGSRTVKYAFYKMGP